MGGGTKFLRSLFGVLLLIGCIWFLSVEIVANQATKTGVIISSAESMKHSRLKHSTLTGRQRLGYYQDLHLNYVSKRRVPNGPDPIHNRRARNSRQPPDRA